MKKKQIDLLDITILNILIEHAELNNKQLSEKIGLSEGPTLVRVQNLWGRGILKSFRADISYEHLGYTKFYFIRAEVSDSEAPELKRRLHLNPYVVFIIEIDGSVDTILRIYLGILQTKNLKAAKKNSISSLLASRASRQ